MNEPIIIDTRLYPDEVYEPLIRTIKNMDKEVYNMSDKEVDFIVLTQYARAIKRECEAHELCVDCPLHQYYKGYNFPTCPFMCAANPTEWTLERRGEGKK